MENTLVHQTNVSLGKTVSFGNLQEVLKTLFEITHVKQKDKVNLRSLYIRFIEEEYEELLHEKPITPNDFKELCDLIWVCIQYANACGYDLEAGMKELVKEYSSKLYDSEGNFNPQYREDGKLLKGPNFKKANFEKLLYKGLLSNGD